MNTRTQALISGVVLVAAGASVYFLTRSGPDPVAQSMEGHDHAAMLAGMDEAQPVRLSEADARRIGVSLTPAVTRALSFQVQAVGVATYDETRLSVVNPKVEGWVEELHVDFNGAPVRAGEPLLDIYAPSLVSAQEELVLAARLAREAGTERARENAEALLESARRRLSYWDIPVETVRRVEETGEVQRTVTLSAPSTGMVVDKAVLEGDRIMPGMVLYRIADLSRIWVEVDVFEQDLGNVRLGQEAQVRFEAFPSEMIPARVTYIYPTVSLESRTGRVRLELTNSDGRLRPGMYAQVTLSASSGAPSVVVPRAAVLETGERAIVFVEDSSGTLVPRAITTGRTSGRDIEVLAGLQAGERVVSSAAFLVDAESNLGALMMDMEGGMAMDGAAMDGMDHSQMDHSEHDMSGGAMDGMDHSEMDHSDHDMPADTTGEMDHSGHTVPPDTTSGGSDHSGHNN